MSCRQFFYDLLRNDPVLNGFGVNTDTLYPNFAPDSPAARVQRFVVLRWGAEGAPAGQDTTVRAVDLEIWAYDTEPDFTKIDAILRRCKVLLRHSEGKSHASGWVNGIVNNGGSPDLPATEYGREAVARNWSFTIHASEEGA